jgi:hypothetical protein
MSEPTRFLRDALSLICGYIGFMVDAVSLRCGLTTVLSSVMTLMNCIIIVIRGFTTDGLASCTWPRALPWDIRSPFAWPKARGCPSSLLHDRGWSRRARRAVVTRGFDRFVYTPRARE